MSDIRHERHAYISDHDTIIVKVDLEVSDDDKCEKNNFCSTDIPLYKKDMMTKAQIGQAKEYLESQDWCDISPEKFTNILNEMVKSICDLRNPEKRTKEGETFKSNNRIPRQVRLWLRRKSLASKALTKVKTPKGCKELKRKIEEAERELSRSLFKRKMDEEDIAISKMRSNPKFFFSYIRKKTKMKTKIGPFTNDKGDIIKEHPSESLQRQYESAWSHPSEFFRIKNPEKFFEQSDGFESET